MDDELDYRTPFDTKPAPQQVSSTDEQNFDTIKLIYDEFSKAHNGLYKNFNALLLSKEATNEVAYEALFRQIAAKQEAYDILTPLMEWLESTIEGINAKYRSQ